MGLVIAFGVILAAGAVAILAGAVRMPARQRRESIERAARAGGVAPEELPDSRSARERLFEPLAQSFGQFVLRVSPKGMAEATEKRLVAAGFIGRVSPAAFIGGRALLGVVGVVLGVIVGSNSSPLAAVLLGAGFGAIFFIFPERRLQSRVANRREAIQADLPDALDLLAVSVEAGLTLDASISILNEHMTGPLADEFALTLGELRIGESRQEALRKLGERTDLAQMASLTRAIIQSDRLGMALGRIMRIQAQEARVKRQGAIEEKANKLPVKMLFPTIIFIFPALFIVILGPAFITIFRTL